MDQLSDEYYMTEDYLKDKADEAEDKAIKEESEEFDIDGKVNKKMMFGYVWKQKICTDVSALKLDENVNLFLPTVIHPQVRLTTTLSQASDFIYYTAHIMYKTPRQKEPKK